MEIIIGGRCPARAQMAGAPDNGRGGRRGGRYENHIEWGKVASFAYLQPPGRPGAAASPAFFNLPASCTRRARRIFFIHKVEPSRSSEKKSNILVVNKSYRKRILFFEVSATDLRLDSCYISYPDHPTNRMYIGVFHES
ncbi:hypothetical protein EVAR_68185_1 [Eumeta japonica]|uniref:Uncharacterized protein n=1 Tax=Eumeta variegata TaxID=151549 RepID=A0A4C1ZXD6_EUMVA|nr:hypothetical protein EVAR_68185_1 [Eumeta japonica]